MLKMKCGYFELIFKVNPKFIKMTTLLFPTDFSPASENAEKFAIEIARKKSAKLHLLHVDDVENNTQYASSGFDDDQDVLIVESPLAKLNNIIKRHRLELFPCTASVKYGETVDIILDMIEDLDIDLLVIGTNGNQNYERSNSNATELIRNANCSVLTIPNEAKYKSIDKIVYASDLIHKDGQAFTRLVKFAKAFNADITLLHVNIDGKDKPGKAPLKPISEIMEAIDYPLLNSEVVIASSLMEGIERYAENNNVDVIAMTSHSTALLDRFFRDSIIEKMALMSKIPILTFSK